MKKSVDTSDSEEDDTKYMLIILRLQGVPDEDSEEDEDETSSSSEEWDRGGGIAISGVPQDLHHPQHLNATLNETYAPTGDLVDAYPSFSAGPEKHLYRHPERDEWRLSSMPFDPTSRSGNKRAYLARYGVFGDSGVFHPATLQITRRYPPTGSTFWSVAVDA
jgi:hypothetical protein